MRIGSYQVLLELARGGMGKVYLARSLGPSGIERLVAIKRAHDHLRLQSAAISDRFLDEARVVAHVHHANVVGMHQAGADADGYYLVLDYVEGESLQGLIDAAGNKDMRVPPQIVLTIVCDALAGLHAAHEATDEHGRSLGILHRDVSTDNLLVGRDGVTRVTDFGIAKSALNLAVTEEGYVHGKLAYMAPEYLRRKPLDRTLDVYGMGVTLWTALAGEGPWPDVEEAQLLTSILLHGIPPLAGAASDIGPEITAVVDRACQLDPRARFPTARALLDALERASKSIGGLARHVEVAEFVENMVGTELAARKKLVKESRTRLEIEHTSVPVRTESPVPQDIDPSTTRSAGTHSRAAEDGSPRRALLYVAIIALAIALGFAAIRRSPAPPVEAAAPVPPTPSAAPQPPASVTASPPEGSVAPSGSAAAEPLAPSPSAVRKPAVQPRTSKQPSPGQVVPFSTANPYR
jgi:serine/threonine-protein kinase